MKHAKPEDLADIEPLLIKIRSVDKLKEKQPGHFYFKGINIVHFHVYNSRIFVDIGDSRIELGSSHDPNETDDVLRKIGEYMKAVSLQKS